MPSGAARIHPKLPLLSLLLPSDAIRKSVVICRERVSSSTWRWKCRSSSRSQESSVEMRACRLCGAVRGTTDGCCIWCLYMDRSSGCFATSIGWEERGTWGVRLVGL